MNTKILIISLMVIAIIIGVGIGTYVNQKSIEAERFGFDSAEELIWSDILLDVSDLSWKTRKALNLDEP